MPSAGQYGQALPYVTSFSVARIPDDNYVARRVLPYVEAPDEDFEYTVWDAAAFVQSDAPAGQKAGQRGIRGTYQQTEVGFDTATGHCEEYGFEAKIDKREYKRGRNKGIDIKRSKGLKVRMDTLTARERRAAALLFNTTTFSGVTVALTSTSRWDNASSDPADQAIAARRLTRRAATSQMGGAKFTALMGAEVFDALLTNPAIISRIQDTSKVVAGNVTAAEIKAYLNLDELIVGGSIYNSVKPTPAGDSLTGADIWGKYCLFYWATPTPGMEMPSMGYTFGTEDYMVEEYYDPARRSDVIRGREVVLEKVTNKYAAYLYSTVIS